MCTTCGCSGDGSARITDPERDTHRSVGSQAHHHDRPHRGHEHEHARADAHTHGRRHGTSIALEQEILTKNGRFAERNRSWLEGRNVVALNLMSAPGAGKTTLLERTIRDLGSALPVSVIEGDQETAFDAERIRATGCRAVQINTGTGCHLEAQMLGDALRALDPPSDSVVMIENVGNLVCPALFDLGERARVVILSVTEGDDKPLKYPHMFRTCGLMIVNKLDLLPHVQFDVDRCADYARQINPRIECLAVSAATGQGTDRWYHWLRQHVHSGVVEERVL